MNDGTITRKTHHRGQHVAVELRDGSRVTGWLNGWGRRIISLRPDPTANSAGWTWKCHSFPVVQVRRVVEVQ